MKLGTPNQSSGTITTERTIKRNKTKEVVAQDSRTKDIGPFCRDDVHGRVGATVGTTLSQNYHSVHVSVSVNIPVHASEQGVDEGLAWSFSKATAALNHQMQGAKKALGKLTRNSDR